MQQIIGFPLFAFIMYAHGLQYFDNNLPTIINRVLTTLLMSIITLVALILHGYDPTPYVGLYIVAAYALWIWPGWISYISEAFGQYPNVPRWLGTLKMTLRNALILPLIALLCYSTQHTYWPCVGVSLLGLPYYINGRILKGKWVYYAVTGGHAIVGVIIWGMISLIIM